MGDGGRVRAVLVDDHRAVREVVRACLELDGRTDVVGEAGDGGEAVVVIRETRPDVVVLDLEMPVANGLEVSAAVRRDLPGTRVVLFSSVPDVSGRVELKFADHQARCARSRRPMDAVEGVAGTVLAHA